MAAASWFLHGVTDNGVDEVMGADAGEVQSGRGTGHCHGAFSASTVCGISARQELRRGETARASALTNTGAE